MADLNFLLSVDLIFHNALFVDLTCLEVTSIELKWFILVEHLGHARKYRIHFLLVIIVALLQVGDRLLMIAFLHFDRIQAHRKL